MTKLQALKVAFIEGLMSVPRNSVKKKKRGSPFESTEEGGVH